MKKLVQGMNFRTNLISNGLLLIGLRNKKSNKKSRLTNKN